MKIFVPKKQDNGYEEPWIFLQQADPDKKSLLCLHKADRKARPNRPLMISWTDAASWRFFLAKAQSYIAIK